MFKKLLISSAMLALCLNSAFAKNPAYQAKTYPQHTWRPHYQLHPRSVYKGEIPYTYKGEVPVAQTCPQEHFPCRTNIFNPGPYLGFMPGLRTNYSPQATAVYKSLEGTLFAGYTLTSLYWYFAAEVYGSYGLQLQNYTNALNANGNTVGLRSTWSLGLNLVPGYVVSDNILLFLLLGSATTHFQDVARTKTGGQVGIGLEGRVSENWGLRSEYVYSFYPTLPALGTPRSDQFRLGVVYRFF